MSDYVLSCCSTVDLTAEYFAMREIHYVCFHYELDGKQYRDDFGQSMAMCDFYKAMDDGAMTRTSQVSVGEYMEYFEPFLKEGKDILHVTLSSGISGTYNSACEAARELAEDYPDRKIYVVDSLGASSGYGLLMVGLADQRDAGASLEEVRDWAMQMRLRVQHWFFSTDLKYYIRGGRISRTAGFFGGLLGICPLLDVDGEGKLVPRFKIRGRRKVIKAIVDQMENYAANGTAYDGKCYISHSADMEDAKAVAELVEKTFPKLDGRVRIFDIGTTIGSHTGPGTVALFFWGTERDIQELPSGEET
uniref:DegV family protein n=1 Tax=Eubacterium cellulosolvens TaxID=29322 RepID=UPI0004862A59|nr:DegV family protein [[Eubacterium] cellulosolvens]